MIPAPDLRSTYESFEQRLSWFSSRVWLVVGCLTSQHASVSEERIRADTCPCCHTETEVADLTFYFTQSQYTYTGPTSPSADLISPGTWQSNSRSTNLKAAGMTGPGRRSLGKSGIQPSWYDWTWEKIPGEIRNPTQVRRSRGGRLTTWPK